MRSTRSREVAEGSHRTAAVGSPSGVRKNRKFAAAKRRGKRGKRRLRQAAAEHGRSRPQTATTTKTTRERGIGAEEGGRKERSETTRRNQTRLPSVDRPKTMAQERTGGPFFSNGEQRTESKGEGKDLDTKAPWTGEGR